MSDLWVFGYGSLMWRPGFAFEEAVPARLHRAHRALCVYSIHHRGSAQRPGLVLGLDAGGWCDGIAFRVSEARARRTRMYLKAREQVTRVYREAWCPVQLTHDNTRVRALCFLADNAHPQYAGRLPVQKQAWLVRHAQGKSGANTDYLAKTVRHLSGMGIAEPKLSRLLPLVGIRTGALMALPCERDMSVEI